MTFPAIAIGTIVLLPMLWQPAEDVAPNCVRFTTGRLGQGQSFRQAIGGGLEARLRAEGRFGWHISVGPSGSPDDYLWVVSPPFRTAPHLSIGPTYGWTASQSAKLSPRKLRFVTSAREYQQAKQLVERATGEPGAPITVDDIERRGRGSLELTIVEFKETEAGRALAWVRVDGTACRPR